jgi:putative sigma-54 modulation protein
MQISIKATGIELTPAISEYVDKKVSMLEKYLEPNPDIIARVEVGKDTNHHKHGEIFRAEVHIVGAGKDVYAVEHAVDLYAAIDKVKDRAAHELTSGKGRRFALARRGGRKVKDMMRGIFRKK